MERRAGGERDLHVALLHEHELFRIDPAHVQQQHVGAEETELFQARDIAQAVLQQRCDLLRLVFACVPDDAHAALLRERAELAQELVRAGDRNPRREPCLDAAVVAAVSSATISSSRASPCRGSKKFLGSDPCRRHVEHGARPAAHAASPTACASLREVVAGIGESGTARIIRAARAPAHSASMRPGDSTNHSRLKSALSVKLRRRTSTSCCSLYLRIVRPCDRSLPRASNSRRYFGRARRSCAAAILCR